MKYISFLLLLTVVHFSFSQSETGFFKQYNQPKVFDTPPSVSPKGWSSSPVSSSTQIIIKLTDTLAPVLSTQFGVNTTFRNGSEMATDGVRLPMYQHAKLNAYRFPAGSGSNKYFWDGQIPDSFLMENVGTIDGLRRGNLTSDLFVDFLDSTQAEGIIVVNYFYARYGKTVSSSRAARVNQAASYAASWVRHMNITRGANIKYWEIGNECYGRWETGWDVNGSIVTGKEYGEDLRVFADSMKAVDPTIKIGAVLHHTDSVWNKAVLREVHDKADFLIVHQYFTPPTNDPQQILDEVPKVGEIATQVRQEILNHTPKTPDELPLCMTEFNCRGRHRITMTNALFTSQVIGELIKNRYGLANIWVSEWKHNDTEANATAGFLAVEDPNQPDYSARPSYMPFHLYGKCFGDQMLASQINGSSALKVYASRFSSGEVGLVVINPTAIPEKATFRLDTTFKQYEAYWYELTAQNIEVGNTRFYLNGQTAQTTGGGPLHFTQIPFYKENQPEGKVFSALPWSVNFIVLQPKTSSSTSNDMELTPYFRLYPNPTQATLRIQTNQQIDSVEVLDISGRSLLKQQQHSNGIDISEIPAGNYIVRIHAHGRQFIRKLIIK